MSEITYYLKDNNVVAMSCCCGHGGFTFHEGSLFKDRCPASMGNGFTTHRSSHCETQAILTKRVKELERKLTTTLRPEPLIKRSVTDNVYTEEYKQFREKYGK